MRLIDADALLENLKKTDRYFTLKNDLENAPTVCDGWNNCLFSTPKESGYYLVSVVVEYKLSLDSRDDIFKKQVIDIVYWDSSTKEFLTSKLDDRSSITAWMTLPEPYGVSAL